MTDVCAVDAVLPQTQCGECGYLGCRPYAEALVQGVASIDRCPPGGAKTVKALGALLNIDPTPYLAKASANQRLPAVAIIREAECIGCTKCIQACPVDAIVGASKQMHMILTHECTGCGLCIEPCPVDCIEMLPKEQETYSQALARERFQAKKIRQLREEHERERLYQEKRKLAKQSTDQQYDKQAKQAYILEAMARARQKKVNITS